MTKVYVLAEVGFEYNDEVYTQSEHGGGTPTVVYRSQEKAREAARMKTCEYLLGGESLGYFGYDIDDVFNDVEAAATIIKKYDADLANELPEGEWEVYEKLSGVLEKLSMPDLMAFANTLSLEFYKVYEVEIDEQ